MDPLKRFSTRVENYAKYRPGYPVEIIDLLSSQCDLSSGSTIADVGSGTGILSEMFLKKGCRVFGIEPNEAMRVATERLLQPYSNFVSINGTAEATTLPDKSVDLVTAAQAFHWFKRDEARVEFNRILKPGGWIALIWNERQLNTTAFLAAYEDLLLRFGTDYKQVRHENVLAEIDDFFGARGYQSASFENAQHFDLSSMRGRVQSASYTPEPGTTEFESMMSELSKMFDAHQIDNRVSFFYTTKIYYGRS